MFLISLCVFCVIGNASIFHVFGSHCRNFFFVIKSRTALSWGFFNLLYIYPFACKQIVNNLLSMLFSSTFFSMYLPAVFLYLFSVYSFLNVCVCKLQYCWEYHGNFTKIAVLHAKICETKYCLKVFLSPVIQFCSISDLAWILSRRIQSTHQCLQKGEHSLFWRIINCVKVLFFLFLFLGFSYF